MYRFRLMSFYKKKDYIERIKDKDIKYKKKITEYLITQLLSNIFFSQKNKQKRFVIRKPLSSQKYKNFASIMKVKLTRRCIFTNKSKTFSRSYNISRNKFRENLSLLKLAIAYNF